MNKRPRPKPIKNSAFLRSDEMAREWKWFLFLGTCQIKLLEHVRQKLCLAEMHGIQ
jgi:hypothetical protein